MATADIDNVITLQTGATPETQPRQARRKDHRAAARKAKSRSKNKIDRDAGHNKDAPPLVPAVMSPEGHGVTPSPVDLGKPRARAVGLPNFRESYYQDMHGAPTLSQHPAE